MMTETTMTVLNDVRNVFVVPYLYLLKEGQYLAVVDTETDALIASFYCRDDRLYEYFDLLTVYSVDEYIDFKLSYSFLYREVENWQLHKYQICERDEWLGYLRNTNKLSVVNAEHTMNVRLITEKVKADGSKLISFDGGDTGILYGACSSDEDYYWIYITASMKVSVSSCVGDYVIVDNEAERQSILSDKARFKELIERYFSQNGDYIFAEAEI